MHLPICLQVRPCACVCVCVCERGRAREVQKEEDVSRPTYTALCLSGLCFDHIRCLYFVANRNHCRISLQTSYFHAIQFWFCFYTTWLFVCILDFLVISIQFQLYPVSSDSIQLSLLGSDTIQLLWLGSDSYLVISIRFRLHPGISIRFRLFLVISIRFRLYPGISIRFRLSRYLH